MMDREVEDAILSSNCRLAEAQRVVEQVELVMQRSRLSRDWPGKRVAAFYRADHNPAVEEQMILLDHLN